ncbi:hypothetical protein SprV_0501752200 [Sparganum proliferum]
MMSGPTGRDDYLEFLMYAAERTKDLIKLVEEARDELVKIRDDWLIKSTVGTAASTVGTAMSVIGLIGLPMTLGTSLLLTGVGGAIQSVSAGTGIVTDRTRDTMNNNTIERINRALEDYVQIAEQLGEIIRSLPSEISEDSHGRLRALMSAANGIRTLRGNWTLLRRGLTQTLRLFDVPRKTAYVTSVKCLGSVARAISYFGVGLQAVEIASLVKEWDASHPEVKAVDELLRQLRDIQRRIEDEIRRFSRGFIGWRLF